MSTPATHPLTGQSVRLPDGSTGTVLKVYEKCTTAPERAMLDVAIAPGRYPVIPTADLKVAS